jgi:hypothetical protein
MTETNTMRRLRTLSEIADILQRAERTLFTQAARGAIPGIRKVPNIPRPVFMTDATDAELVAWNNTRRGSGRPCHEGPVSAQTAAQRRCRAKKRAAAKQQSVNAPE